jgi:hypothetical protein
MPPEGLMLVRGQIDLDIDRGVKKLCESLRERLELRRGPFRIPHQQRVATVIVRLCLAPGEARMIVYKVAVVHDAEHRVSRVHDRGDIRLRELLRIAPGPVRHGKGDAREGAV